MLSLCSDSDPDQGAVRGRANVNLACPGLDKFPIARGKEVDPESYTGGKVSSWELDSKTFNVYYSLLAQVRPRSTGAPRNIQEPGALQVLNHHQMCSVVHRLLLPGPGSPASQKHTWTQHPGLHQLSLTFTGETRSQ
jgi:hypothetical protein